MMELYRVIFDRTEHDMTGQAVRQTGRSWDRPIRPVAGTHQSTEAREERGHSLEKAARRFVLTREPVGAVTEQVQYHESLRYESCGGGRLRRLPHPAAPPDMPLLY